MYHTERTLSPRADWSTAPGLAFLFNDSFIFKHRQIPFCNFAHILFTSFCTDGEVIAGFEHSVWRISSLSTSIEPVKVT